MPEMSSSAESIDRKCEDWSNAA